MNASTSRAGFLLGMAITILGFVLPVHPPSAVPHNQENLTVEFASSRVDNDTIHVTIRFTNRNVTPIWILKPVDGSTFGAYMPDYSFTLTDSLFNVVRHGPGHCNCMGLYSSTTWPVDYLTEIPAGGTFEHFTRVPYTPTRPGRYRVDFRYQYRPTENDFPPPPQAWRGTLVAKPVVVECNPVPPRRLGNLKELERGK